ncbi:MAG: hypothetical protein PHN90_03335 [Methanothrix sp.]|jgi:small basic protein|nr:hypothetical protein [Methanothrix sp.]OPX78371.1 MAG: hypothetical protein A4E50_02179 [Methanosaeta sp. PtaB.Bin087]OPY50509.1 MAG: hypothetical protein A4E51_01727 [Methanosaeta sp. PtaU1.Bin055]NLX39084.1 hypothetical protein [Methanothrix sp.]HNT73199.1 hypothetical protein [Methanothrix sp.]
MSVLTNFKRRSVASQTLVAGLFFFLIYALYLDYLGRPSLGESLFAATIFATSYFVTSTIVLRKKSQRRK